MNKKGFTLVQVLIAAGLIGGLSLALMQLMDNTQQAGIIASSNSEEIELKTFARSILNKEKFCRVSFAGDGPAGSPSSPVVFNKDDNDEDNEGLDVELFYSNQAGTLRSAKKLSGTDPAANKYGKIRINSIKLIFDNGTGFDYSPAAQHSDIALLKIEYSKKASRKKWRNLKHYLPVSVGLSTNASGDTTILSCSLEEASPSNIDIQQVQAVIPNQSGTTPNYGYAQCPSDRVAISCGFEKRPSTGDQDDTGCFVDIPQNRCAGWRDQDGGTGSSLRVLCYCAKF